MDELSAIVLVGGKGTRLLGLTKDKSKPYVSFFGKYRIIDFPLSSISYSNIKNVSILTQYEPYELMKYIGNGTHFDLNFYNAGINYLTPFEDSTNEFTYQKGTANAVYTQIENIKNFDSKYILILSGDQVYSMDFNEPLKRHIESGADLTIISGDKDEKEDLSRFGILEYDDSFRVTCFTEKPANPKTNHISLGMYIFTKEYLLSVLPLTEKLVDFGRDLIPYLINRNDNVYTYKHDGIFMDLGTVESLYQGNMYFLNNPTLINQKGSKIKVYSKALNYFPSYIGTNAEINKSIISNGVILNGKVSGSIISTNAFVDEETEIIDSVILPSSKILKGSKLKNVLVDEGVIVPENSTLEFDKVTLIDSLYFKNIE